MTIGTRVKVSGTKDIGTIQVIEERREGTSTAKVFYTVLLDSGLTQEYTRDELRYI